MSPQASAGPAIAAVVFDKDGTLFDFQRTWGVWAQGAISTLARGDQALAARLAEVIEFDLAAGLFHPHSPAIAGTSAELAILLAAEIPGRDAAQVLRELDRLATQARPAEAAPLRPLLAALAGRGLRLGVATNDSEGSARAQLQQAGVLEAFDQVLGYDSGFGGKPAPGMLLGFCDLEGVRPEQAVMVGDSLHDLHAGRAAGMATIAVLSGLATEAELAPFADDVVPDIGHLLSSEVLQRPRRVNAAG